MRARRPIIRLILCLVLIATVPLGGAGAADSKLALVIGNAAYRNASPLVHPVPDAAEMAAVLDRLGFEVDLRTDLDQRSMEDAFRTFGYAAPSADVALVFYSGHGIQVAGVSYLLPVDAVLRRERDLIYEALPLDLVLDEAAQARGLGLVILDAARENPLAERLRQALGPVAAQRVEDGIGRIDNVPSETLVALSTRPGTTTVATDTVNSPYVSALLEHIEEPGLELDLLFRKVRDSVLERTGRRQEPRTYDSLGAEPFYFRDRPNRPPMVGEFRPLEVFDDGGPVALGLPPPSDPDGDRLMVEVIDVPDQGQIRTDDEILNVGDQVDLADFPTLSYLPVEGFTGAAGAFGLMIDDQRGGAIRASLPIVVKSSNRPPVIPERRMLKVSSVPLNIQTPIDPEGDAMTAVVTQLPEKGIVRDGGRVVEVGDELSISDLVGLFLMTEEGGAFGTFAFEVIDQEGARSSSRLDIALSTSFERGTGTSSGERGEPAPAPAPLARPDEPQAEVIVKRAEPPPASVEPVAVPPAAATATADDDVEQGPPIYRTIRMSNIRAEPTVEAERVATVPPDTLLKVVGETNGSQWLEVETEDGQSGFIYFALVQPVSLAAVKAKLPYVRSSGELKTE